MTEIATIDWFGRWGASVFSENTAIFLSISYLNHVAHPNPTYPTQPSVHSTYTTYLIYPGQCSQLIKLQTSKYGPSTFLRMCSLLLKQRTFVFY